MKNLLKLHEAIAIALLNAENRSATFDEIADFIIRRELFLNRKGNITLSKQIMLRTTQSSQRYAHLFEIVSDGIIRLRNVN